MEARKLFTMSEQGKSEYCCNVVRIGEIVPIEGSDFLGKTLVNGESIVIRKDQVQEGSLMFYASHECQLNADFLSANNLYEISEFERNANAEELRATVNEANELSASAKAELKLAASIKKAVAKVKKSIQDNGVTPCNTARKMLLRKCEVTENPDSIDNEALVTLAEAAIVLHESNAESYRAKCDELRSNAKRHVGFFNKYGRVKMLRLRGVPSMGFLFTVNEMAKYCPAVTEVNLEELLEKDFDTVNGELFVKAYVPPVKPVHSGGGKGQQGDKAAKRFDRMIAGEFLFHYDTDPLPKNMHKIKPDDVVTVTVKLHGTSVIIANVRTKTPLPWYKHIPIKAWNGLTKLIGLSKLNVQDYKVEYGNVYSSRKVIKNQTINPQAANGHYYSTDVWGEANTALKPYIDEGMTVYGEIVGFGRDGRPIQGIWDYGCASTQMMVYPYRITTTTEDGKKKEWNVCDVIYWTIDLIKKHPELTGKVGVLPLLWHGTLQKLYPDIPVENHWHENVLERLKVEKRFGMEEHEEMCRNEVAPREGVCLRIDDDPFVECFKLKTVAFRIAEGKLIDNGEVDEEMAENFS